MSKLVWDATGERYYETGVKNGVLYVMDTDGTYMDGVAWNGLTAVTESPSGAEVTDLYADDIKRERWEHIDAAMDELRRRYGYLSIRRAIVQLDPLLAGVDPSQHVIHPVGYFVGA